VPARHLDNVPDDVREEYGRRHGPRFEAKFFALANTGSVEAKRLFRERENEVDARIEAIRAERTGEGVALTRDKPALSPVSGTNGS
jgi:hypothetical protein